MKKLKKQIGAGFLSLAMLSSVGLHNAAFADPDPTTDYNIAVNDGDGYDIGNPTATFTDGVNQVIDNENSENNVAAVQPQSEASIRGWQTEEPEGYAVNVTWGDMVFVYDRGQFDPETGTLKRATDVDGVIGYQNFSRGPNRESIEDKVNVWYGFDCVNNRIRCQNLSTGDIRCTPSAIINNTSHPNVTCSLYKLLDYSTALNIGWSENTLGLVYNTEFSMYSKVEETYNISGHPGSGRGFCNVNGLTLDMVAPVRTADGLGYVTDYGPDNENSLCTRSQLSFLLGLDGAPGSSLTTDSTDPAVIGSITLTFSKPEAVVEP